MHIDQSVLDGLILALFVAFLGIVRYFSKRFFDRLDKQDTALETIKEGAVSARISLERIEVVLGVNSDNGIRGTVRKLDERVNALEKAI